MSRAQAYAPKIPAPAKVDVSTPEAEAPDVETSSDAYAQRFAGPVGDWFLRVQEQSVLRLLADWPAARVLEVGGGHGQLAPALVRQGYQLTVLGSDRRCAHRLHSLVESDRCRFQAGDLLHLPYPAKAFDVVISIRLLAHMEEWRQVISELTRVARRAVIIDYPPARSLNCLVPSLFSAKQHLEGNTRPFQVYPAAVIAEAFAQHGFLSRRRTPQFCCPMVVQRVLRQPWRSQRFEGLCQGLRLTRWFGSPMVELFERRER